MEVYGEVTGVTHFTILDKKSGYIPGAKKALCATENRLLRRRSCPMRNKGCVWAEEEEEYFKIFLKGIKDRVIDVYYSQRFKTGYERLEAVMIEAKNTPVD